MPWLGVLLVGCGLGAEWSKRRWRLAPPVDRAWSSLPRLLRHVLATTGRWSLTIYLVHQPLLLGSMGVVKRLSD